MVSVQIAALAAATLWIRITHDHDSVTIGISGDASERHIAEAITGFQETLTGTNKIVVIDLSRTRVIDGRFFGLLLMLRKRLKGQGTPVDVRWGVTCDEENVSTQRTWISALV